MAGGNRKVLAVFIFLTAVQFTFGIIFIVLSWNAEAREGTLRSKRHSRELTCHSRLEHGPQKPQLAVFESCILNPRINYIYRLPYTCFSLFYGQDVPPTPLGLLRVSKPFCHRYRIIPDCDKTFLLDMWTKINLADSSENSGQ